MNIMIVSQCSKKALIETRRIVDQFAIRVGDRTWLTPITQQGLTTLQTLLQKTARKNTAVACHYIHRKNHVELLWVVGDRRQFDEDGQVPTHTTGRNILRAADEHTWHSAGWVHYGGRIAALFHDFGKANAFFAQKLNNAKRSKQPIADPYRHEWVSLRLFEAFVRYYGIDNDLAWLQALADLSKHNEPDLTWLNQLQRDGLANTQTPQPLNELPPIAQWIGWLIISHHRLPVAKSWSDQHLAKILNWIKAENCYPKTYSDSEQQLDQKTIALSIQQCWTLAPEAIPISSQTWRIEAAACAQRLLRIAQRQINQGQPFNPNDPYLAHITRLALMLSDHHYSSQPATAKWHDPSYRRYANTDRDGNLKQPLDDHLIGVSQGVRQLIPALLLLKDSLPSLIDKKSLTKPAKQAKFLWQDKAFATAKALQQASEQQGFFGVNLASTGCGKTLANARIMYGLSDPEQGARFSIALGLRTLTLQTGRALRERLGLTEHEVAVMVGGGAVRALFERDQASAGPAQPKKNADDVDHSNDPQQSANQAEHMGSESLFGFDWVGDSINFSGALPDDSLLAQWFAQHPDIKKLLSAPILTCTIDHLIPATESTRGGRQIAPMLRLMSSDLVIDEPDDFAPEDWYALARLVNWAGLLGSRVLLSSATLTPAEVNGLFAAYQAGREQYRKHRCIEGTSAAICCAWFDEFGSTQAQVVEPKAFQIQHRDFSKARAEQLSKQPQRRQVEWVGNGLDWSVDEWPTKLADALRQSMQRAHQLNRQTDPKTGKQYSIGLIRMANINTIAQIAQQLISAPLAANTRLHLCVYHSRFPLLIRSTLERQLDQLLNRQQHAPHDHAWMQDWLTQPESEHIVVILASPVAEVGRDHDYDWMIVEPSSMRAIIQVVGRVRRHRDGAYAHPNVFLLNTNTRHYRQPNRLAFCKPGFESDQGVQSSQPFRLLTHDVQQLIRPAHIQRLDAQARLRPAPPDQFDSTRYLADLEHERMLQVLLGGSMTKGQPLVCQYQAHQWWSSPIHQTAYMQSKTRFRLSQPDALVVFVSDEADAPFTLKQFNQKTGNWLSCDSLCERIELVSDPAVSLWPSLDWVELLQDLDDEPDDWAAHCRRYLTLNMQVVDQEDRPKKWQYHDWLGFFN